MRHSKREKRSYLPEVQEELRLREELKNEALPTAAYCRLSNMDIDEGSIEAQISMVQEYIQENPELRLVDTYVDNGFSGTDFDRPEWNRLMHDLQIGRINCIVVKDLSRFGRNHIEAGQYIENIFPKLGIRFIAIHDNFDNTKDEYHQVMLVPIKNIMNELYAKETGRKVRMTNMRKKKAGIPVGKLPYGYALEKGKVIVDDTEKSTIRMIFEWAKMGVTVSEIVQRLTLVGIPPIQGNRWLDCTICGILENPFYQGALIFSAVPGKGRTDAAEDIIIYNDHHEPIISKEEFEALGVAFEEKREKTNSSANQKRSRYLNGMVYCAVCGKRMIYRNDRDRFYCNRHGGAQPEETQMDICPAVSNLDARRRARRRCRSYLKELNEIRPILEAVNRKNGIFSRVTKSATEALSEKKKVEAYGERIYEDFIAGVIDEEEFSNLRGRFTRRLEDKTKILNDILSKQRRLKTMVDELKIFLKEVSEINEITDENLHLMVERVDVYPSGHIKVGLKHYEAYKLIREEGAK